MTARSMKRPRPSSGCSPRFGAHPPPAAEPEARQHGERPARTGLAEHAEIVDRQRTVGESAKALAQKGFHRRPFGLVGQARGQGEMEPPLLQHIGITPAHQQLVLPRAEAGAAPARQLRLVCGPAELVELHDAAIGQVLQLGAARRRHEGEKARDLGKFERRNREGAVARGEPSDGVEEIALAGAIDQRDRRLQGAVEAVEPRVGRDLDQPIHRDAGHRPQRPRLPGFGITPEPLARRDGESLSGPRRVIERVAWRGGALAVQVMAPRRPIMAKRSLLETKSIRATAIKMRTMINEVCCSSSVRIASARCKPMPPAPTMPMMLAERVFDSKEYRTWLASTGKISGRMPKRMPSAWLPPVDTMPSTGFRSAASIASEKSLPKEPMSAVMMASAPANGPSPTTLIQISAHTKMSTLRMVSSERREKKRTTRWAVTLRAASKASGKANTAADNVPRKAMATVSSSATPNVRACAQLPGSGGSINPMISTRRALPESRVPPKKPSCARPNSSRAKAAIPVSKASRRWRSKRVKCCGWRSRMATRSIAGRRCISASPPGRSAGGAPWR